MKPQNLVMLMVVTNKIIHFGEFVRWHRVNRAMMTTEQFAREVGVTARRLIAIESTSTPDIAVSTLGAMAKALGMDPDHFDLSWKLAYIDVIRRRAGS